MSLTLTYPEGGVLVTGGTGNVGSGAVRQFARAGVPVVFTYQSSQKKADKLLAELTSEGHAVWSQQLDMTDLSSVQAALDRVVDECGAIHGLACGAGPMIPFGRIADIPPEVALDFLDQDAVGYLRLFQAAVRMFRDKGGSITACSSMATSRVVDFDGMSPFSKGSVNALIRQVAAEEADRKIRCNGVAIGWIQETPFVEGVHPQPEQFETEEDHINAVLHQVSSMVRIKRCGTPEDAGNLFAFLASDQASYINGQIITIDGGSSL